MPAKINKKRRNSERIKLVKVCNSILSFLSIRLWGKKINNVNIHCVLSFYVFFCMTRSLKFLKSTITRVDLSKMVLQGCGPT